MENMVISFTYSYAVKVIDSEDRICIESWISSSD